MRTVSVLMLAGLLLLLPAGQSKAEGNMRIGVAADVLIPMGDYADIVSTGFGGTAWLEYQTSPEFSVLGLIGYYSWGGKDIDLGGFGSVSGPSVNGFSIRVGGRYYLMPAGGTRVYGQGELGLLFASTDFAFAPVIGVTLPLSPDIDLDLSGRYDVVATTGTSLTSIGFRAGVSFGLK